MGYTSIPGADRNRTIHGAKLERTQTHDAECKKTGMPGGDILFHEVPLGFWSLEYSHYYRTRCIYFTLIEVRGDGHAWKTMEESSGPYYYDCPLRFREAAPVRNAEWRMKCVGLG